MAEQRVEVQCPEDWHEEIKADESLWDAEMEPPYGHAECPVVSYERLDRFVRVGNCRRCHSTLYAPVEIRLRRAG